MHTEDGEEKVTRMLYMLAVLSWWQPVGIIFNLLQELPPGFAMIHFWGLAQEQSQDAVKFSFDVRLAQQKAVSNSFPSSRQVHDQTSRRYLSGLSLMKLCLPDTCVLNCTVVFKETFFFSLYNCLK